MRTRIASESRSSIDEIPECQESPFVSHYQCNVKNGTNYLQTVVQTRLRGNITYDKVHQDCSQEGKKRKDEDKRREASDCANAGLH